MADQQYEKYRGLRAVILTRVSTQKQEEKYSHAAQERQVREKLIAPLGLRIVDEARHIIHDTYSGLEYRYREALERILEMAERQEFDLLTMDVLDRGLGRKALARELFRMQLRELGVRVLTTEPGDHADDDSLEGWVMRAIKGSKAEEEINDFVRRTKSGRREKTLGNPEKGIPAKIIGGGTRLYGYKFVSDEKGVHIGYELNLEVICTDNEGNEWTEVAVVRFIFASAASGISVHGICALLNAKGIPSPYVTKGLHHKRMKNAPVWQHIAVRRILANSAYYGEYRQFKALSLGRQPGHNARVLRHTSEDEQVVIPIPAIVTKELAEKANKRVAQNQNLSTRTNQISKESLLSGGFARCAACGSALRVDRVKRTRETGPQEEREYYDFYYDCPRPHTRTGRCVSCPIRLDLLDRAVAEYIVEIIRDPSEVDQKIADWQKKHPVNKREQQQINNLRQIREEILNRRTNMSRAMGREAFDAGTIAHLNEELRQLETREREAEAALADVQRMQREQELLARRVTEFHQRCAEMREQLDDPAFRPDFHFNREAVFFFGIIATVYRPGVEPRYDIHTDPPEIVGLLS